MSDQLSDPINHARATAFKLFSEWLIDKELLFAFERPETVPAVLFHKKYPAEQFEFVENLLMFLSSFQIIEEAGGTYKLTKSKERINSELDTINLSDAKNRPVYQFIKYGLKLVNERFEGGSGIWDLDNFGYVFERGFTEELLHYYSAHLSNIIDLDRLYVHESNPKIALYALYPEKYIKSLDNLIKDNSGLTIITPNEKLKNKAITYCELTNQQEYSLNIITIDNLTERDFNLVFSPIGLGFHKPLKQHIKLINEILMPGGFLYFGLPNSAETQIGIEPLFTTHPNFNPIPDESETERVINSNGFSFNSDKRIGPNDYFYFCTKDDF